MNIAWAAVNVALAYLLLARVWPLDHGEWSQIAIALAGFILMTLQVVRAIRRLGPSNPR